MATTTISGDGWRRSTRSDKGSAVNRSQSCATVSFYCCYCCCSAADDDDDDDDNDDDDDDDDDTGGHDDDYYVDCDVDATADEVAGGAVDANDAPPLPPLGGLFIHR